MRQYTILESLFVLFIFCKPTDNFYGVDDLSFHVGWFWWDLVLVVVGHPGHFLW